MTAGREGGAVDGAVLGGLLVIDKPAGWTSHDVVARVRRLAGRRRCGHAGTLDPLATGVLPLGLGSGTRMLEYLGDADKAYRATIRLGRTTDTDDADGLTLEERPWGGVTTGAIADAIAAFLGEIDQTPPIYSAIKRDGVPLHRLARAGAAVQVAPRRVRIDRIDVLDITPPHVTIEVACSKGTYIRSLARDLGATLGCGAHLAALRRLRHGPFTEADVHTLEAVAAAVAEGRLAGLLLPLDLPLATAPAITVDERAARLLLTGRIVPCSAVEPEGRLGRAYDSSGRFLAVVRATAGAWAPVKVFARPEPAA
ncbi:MAG: tRNA pseudouridine(55) synthase TruB [Dehalococcoidia bacterium]